MPRPSLSDAAALIDPFQTYNYSLTFPSIPGDTRNQSQALVVKCQATSLPGFGMETVDVPFHAIILRYAGRMTYPGTFSTTFLEVRDIATRLAFRQWMMYARNHDKNTGHFKAQYTTNALMELYDDTNSVIFTTVIMNCWPNEVADLSLETSTAAAGQLAITMTYDYLSEPGS